MAKYTKYSDKDGVWRTIGGRRVFIRTNQSLSDAMRDSGKFNRKKMTRKEKEAEYELYKKARQDENSIDPMTENSTDWEALDKKYRDRYENEFNPKVNVKNDRGQWETKRYSDVRAEADRRFNENQEKIKGMTDRLGIAKEKSLNKKIDEDYISYISSTTGSSNDSYGYAFNEMLNEADRKGLKVKGIDIGNYQKNKASIEFENGGKIDFYDLKEGKGLISNASTDDFEKYQGIMNTYRVKKNEDVSYDFNNGGWINNNENVKIPGMNNDKYDKKYGSRYDKDDLITKNIERDRKNWENGISYEEYSLNKAIEKKTNGKYKNYDDLMNSTKINSEDEEDGLLGKMNKDSKMLKSRKDNWSNAEVPKVSAQGKSNRKEVSANIQKHIRDYYDSPEEFVSQMEAMKDPSHPTAWSWGQELAKGGNYLIYNSDMADFLSGLKINPKNKAFNDEQVFNNYTALIGRESAKMYDDIRKNAVKSLSQRYSGTIDYLKETENMSTSEILELLKKMEK